MASVNVLTETAFLLQVERVREEIRSKFARAHAVLVKRETDLLSELLQLEVRYRGEGVTEQIEELNRLKEMELAATKRNENKELIMQHVSQLDDRVKLLGENLEKERASMRRVILDWDGEFENRLSAVGAVRVINFQDYKDIVDPIMVGGKHLTQKSRSNGVFTFPRSICIEMETDNIYICDLRNDRVQVLNKYFAFLFCFSENMLKPYGICISHDKVYVTQFGGNRLNVYSTEGKFLNSVGKTGNKNLEFNQPMGVAVSKAKKIYLCDWGNNRIQCLNIDLSFYSSISIPAPRDIKLTDETILALIGGDLCIRVYNYSHQVINDMIPRGEGKLVSDPYNFCLDREQNILLADQTAGCVLIFTKEGDMIHKFGHRGEGRGEFIRPNGIALSSDFRIIVVSQNPDNCLQLF